ncbi:MAG: YdcF family protein [Bacteroidetes bacterium]|nr:YdcF family protein [Bacteroidota bacterium]MCL5026545.1 YdcF family protein [Chloroflexota bacterium]
MRGILQLTGAVFLLAIVATVVPALDVFFRYQGLIYSDPRQVPPAPTAIVFGAGVTPDGRPSWMLADRVDAAVELYRTGKVQRILMTGDGRSPEYDEVSVMKRYAIAQGVPAGNVDLDRGGVRTYDSSYRARAIFGIQEAVLVTQGYHLPRALYLARAFGIRAAGLKSGNDRYPRQDFYNLREAAADVVMWYEVHVTHPVPRFLGPPAGPERQSE